MDQISYPDIENAPRLYDRYIRLCARGRGRLTGGLTRNQLFDLHCKNHGDDPAYAMSTFEKSYRSLDIFGESRALNLVRGIMSEHNNLKTTRGGNGRSRSSVARSQDPDSGLYEVVGRRLSIDTEAEKNLALAARGYYQLWRYSTTMPGYYSKGVMNIYLAKDSFKTYIEATQGYSDRSQPNVPVAAAASISETVMGYLFPLANGGCVMFARGERFIGFRLAIFNDIEHMSGTSDAPANKKIRSLCGYVMGTSGSNGFISPIYLERIDNYQKHLREVNIYRYDEVPEKIHATLATASLIRF